MNRRHSNLEEKSWKLNFNLSEIAPTFVYVHQQFDRKSEMKTKTEVHQISLFRHFLSDRKFLAVKILSNLSFREIE